MAQPVVGISVDVIEKDGSARAQLALAYADAVIRAGGLPTFLPPRVALLESQIERCDAIVLSGGDDPRTEPFGEPTHPGANPVHPERQEYELALLRALEEHSPDLPVLGVCLGMQLMALAGGGRLHQHLPEVSGAGEHWETVHRIDPTDAGAGLRAGEVRSRHRQAVADPGRLRVLARAPDGVIEAIASPDRRFYVGVQWHPERTGGGGLGVGIFASLLASARRPSP